MLVSLQLLASMAGQFSDDSVRYSPGQKNAWSAMPQVVDSEILQSGSLSNGAKPLADLPHVGLLWLRKLRRGSRRKNIFAVSVAGQTLQRLHKNRMQGDRFWPSVLGDRDVERGDLAFQINFFPSPLQDLALPESGQYCDQDERAKFLVRMLLAGFYKPPELGLSQIVQEENSGLDPVEGLARHLMIAYVNEAPEDDSPLQEEFFEKASGAQRALAIRFAGHAFIQRTDGTLEGPNRERLAVFWEARNNSHPQPMS